MQLLTTTVFAIALGVGIASAQSASPAAAIDTYLAPYVQTGNFAGDVLVEKSGRVVFHKAYGFADRGRRLRNASSTQFHVASVSMQFTAAAVLRLVDAGSLSLDENVGDFAKGIPGAGKIKLRDLLTQRSGLPDINGLPDYDDVLQHHQTPSALIDKIRGRPLLFEPGSKFLHEEHSAYNLLALILERKTRLPFAAAMDQLVFRPLNLKASGVDDDSVPRTPRMAKGYAPRDTDGLAAARAIHWSAKAGNASVFTTAADQARFVRALFTTPFLTPHSRAAILDTSMRVGYGWFRAHNQRFRQTAYYMNGRAPGFASFVLYLPESQMTVVALSNIYSSATTTIGYDLAALSLGLPYEPPVIGKYHPTVAELKTCTGSFQFGPDFYQANATLTLAANGKQLSLRWPSGDVSPLIPLARDRFLDRSYWEEVAIQRDSSGRPAKLIYDHFQGAATTRAPAVHPPH